VTTDKSGTAQDLRDIVEHSVGVCAKWARDLGERVLSLDNAPEDKKKSFLANVENLLKIAERAQNLVAKMRKDEGGGACANSCETFAEAMLPIRKQFMKKLPEVVGEKIDGDTAKVTCKFGPAKQDIDLVKEGGAWKVK